MPDGHLARLVAFASATHRPDQVAAFLAAAGGAAGGPATQTVGRWLPLLVASDGRDAGAVAALAAGGAPCAPALVAFALGAPHSNRVAQGVVASLARMPPVVGGPALVALLRRQRDVRRQARGLLDQALAAALDRQEGGAEAALLRVARWGRVYARAAAQRLLERHGSAAARAEARRLSAQEHPAAGTGEAPDG